MTNRKLTYIAENEVLQIEIPSKICKDWQYGKRCIWYGQSHHGYYHCSLQPCERVEDRDIPVSTGMQGLRGSTGVQGLTGIIGTTGIQGWTGMGQ